MPTTIWVSALKGKLRWVTLAGSQRCLCKVRPLFRSSYKQLPCFPWFFPYPAWFLHAYAFFDFLVSTAIPTRILLILPIFESFWFLSVNQHSRCWQEIMENVSCKITLIDHCEWCGNADSLAGTISPPKHVLSRLRWFDRHADVAFRLQSIRPIAPQLFAWWRGQWLHWGNYS